SRFADAELLRFHEVQSSLAARISCKGQTWGVLTLHEQRRRRFASAEVAFFKAAAAEVGALIVAGDIEQAQ
ncbi:MAG TPA: GAF domain-containing protein, partial [Gemmatimonadaceae bacterium]|nr:GAF domain-containing protein [Gemmatimonadaceae bacterium]